MEQGLFTAQMRLFTLALTGSAAGSAYALRGEQMRRSAIKPSLAEETALNQMLEAQNLPLPDLEIIPTNILKEAAAYHQTGLPPNAMQGGFYTDWV